jgi:hypothetical protein
VRTARKARHQLVEFAWLFTADELRSLRSAVHEWSSSSVGSYKAFGARVLAAINTALDEPDSMLFLNEPRRGGNPNCVVVCKQTNQGFSLNGQATFDLVFGYGVAAAAITPGVDQRLSPSVRQKLAAAVSTLGWSPEALVQERFRPVLNAMYGNALDYGISAPSAPKGPAVDVPVHFHGPFSARSDHPKRPCLFSADTGARSGVYLWTVTVNGAEWPWYVGQTRRGLVQRTAEHLRAYMSGEYPLVDAAALTRGECRRVPGAPSGVWPHNMPDFLQNYEQLAPQISSLLAVIGFFYAPLPDDPHLLNRVEGAIGRHFKSHSHPGLRRFFYPGIRVPAAVPYDRPIRLQLSSDAALEGMPPELFL